MWYVMQVKTGKEEKTIAMIAKYAAMEYAGCCFLPKFERKKRYAGMWHLEQGILFPGYVFVDTDRVRDFYLALKSVPELTKILGTGELWTEIDGEDMKILNRLLNQEHLMNLSEGIIEGSRVRILRGPLMGMETLIRKVDRHKKTARVEIEMFGRRQEIEVGVELLDGIQAEARR